ncbi:DUF1272 domain-containing protein [Aquimarina pacifica]|uniref:DUF1272 domain-containing protein n=1 Tax=Aquimarina pacifica TaxID=1296415 RepID=UPI000471590C|nr:DUF1272 domain-containing protein [Aquimarina pacifica]
MLEIRPTCENCNKKLPNHSDEAMICSFECTFCNTCVEEILENVCPNCGGGFEKRPIRPLNAIHGNSIKKFPQSKTVVYKPIDIRFLQEILVQYKNIKPSKR